MKKFILSETQLRKCVESLINEEAMETSNSLMINFGMLWGMGKWKLAKNQLSTIHQRIEEINSYIKQNKDTKVTIQIESGESQVTNKDTEVTPPQKLEVGELAKRRGTVVNEYLKKYFTSQIGKSITQEQMPIFNEPIVKIGETPYKKGSGDLKDPIKLKLYQEEQHVKAIVSIDQSHKCLIGLNVTIGYFNGKNKSKHTCDEAIFDVKMNGVSIGIVNLNNGKIDVAFNELKGTNIPIMMKIKAKRKGLDVNQYIESIKKVYSTTPRRRTDKMEGGTRSHTFTIGEDVAKRIINNDEKIVLSLVPLVSKSGEYSVLFENGNHTETPWVRIENTNTKKVYFDAEPNVGLNRGDLTETTLMTLDKCGKPIITKKQA